MSKRPHVPNDYPGNGTIKCGICGDPVVEHKIGPCPKAGVTVFHISTQTRYRKRRHR